MKLSSVLFFLLSLTCLKAQTEVPILTYEVTATGTPRIEVRNDPALYYVLYANDLARTLVQSEGERAVLTEPLAALPEGDYRVVAYERSNPADLDADGIDDFTELNAYPTLHPLNPVVPIPLEDGTACLHSQEAFDAFAFLPGEADENSRLAELEFLKFYILDNDETDSVRVYYMNTVLHEAHVEFARAVGIPTQSNGNSFLEDMRGLLVYHPEVTAPSGEQGTFTFEFQQFDDYTFALIKQTFELLGATMPFLDNRLAYLPLHRRALARYNTEREIYDASRIPVMLEGDLYEGIDYLPLNKTEGYGRLRLMAPGERPEGRDIVVYETIPNDLPRVGGIVTTVVQTPLSHVNLRALQNDVPNAFIRDALDDPDFSDLLGKFVYYQVEEDEYTLREATPAEVDAHYENLRPDEAQIPIRDLSVTVVTPLPEIGFEDHAAFGAKTGNVGVMHGFDFPPGVIPNGFGIPFYFYDEFMKFNDFYTRIEALLANPDFQTNFAVQDDLLDDLRDDIEDAPLPDWMFAALTDLQNRFPEGTNIRCRSSTNNEDLPGFSGAGLYDSKTHNTDEGHLGKTVKEVFAGMWNFRAFTEREFYRVDHFKAAMGVLVHPNFKEEEANGVGITSDPIYSTNGTYYLNTQVGEDLVTNPDGFSIPEEILLDIEGAGPTAYEILRRSNLVTATQQVLPLEYLDELRPYMAVIHAEFAELYGSSPDDEEFAMDIEYKIDSTGQLVIKQARPWIGFLEGSVATQDEIAAALGLRVYPNPVRDVANVKLSLTAPDEVDAWLFDLAGRPVLRVGFGRIASGEQALPVDVQGLPAGGYVLRVRVGGLVAAVPLVVIR